MKLIIDKSEDFYPTKDTFLDSVAIDKNYGVVFEVNEDTAYFYAVSLKNNEQNILDALHIYNTSNITDSDIKSNFKIIWSEDYKYAILFINDYPHAIFDFKNKQGYNRTGFPPGASHAGWSKNSKNWNDSILDQFKN